VSVRAVPPPAIAPVSVRVRVPEPPPVNSILNIPTPAPVLWVGEGETVTIASTAIRGGLLYSGVVARSLAYKDEPSVIDPTLPVAATGSYAAWTASYWPQYKTCSSNDRRSLLTWLADGRKDPNAPIGLVFLYFYGLERRLLDDARTLSDARRDVPRLVAEIDRLRRIYRNGSFQSYAGALRDLAIAMYGDPARLREFADCRPGHPPSALLVALGRRIGEGAPLTSALAYAWARTQDSGPRPSAVASVADELQALFEVRYAQRYGEGLVVPRPKRKLMVEHRGAALNRMNLRLEFDIPDVRNLTAPQRPLLQLLDECLESLQRLAKARKRDPIEPLEIASTLPPELKSSSAFDELSELKAFAEQTLRDHDVGVASVDDLIHAASMSTTDKLRKRECVVLASALERLGFGMEPDIRWLGPPLCLGTHVALYRCSAEPSQAPTSSYRMAQLLLQMAVAVASADGTIDEIELHRAREHIDAMAGLETSERSRLRAHLTWLTVSKPSLSKLLGQLRMLASDQRRSLANAAVGVAAADGRIDPDEVRTLEKIYRALGIPVSEVAADAHRALTGTTSRAPDSTGLDAAALARKMEETADVQKLLTSIFTEDEPTSVQTSAPYPVAAASQDAQRISALRTDILGLDDAHTTLLRRVLDEADDVVERARIDDWCRELGLMSDGALESLNEAAFNLAGDALFEADDDLVVHPDVREQLRSIFEGAVA
jgi:tellurite resistance protein